MNRRIVIPIVVGLLVLGATFLLANMYYQTTAPTAAELNACVASGQRPCIQSLIQRSDQAGQIKTNGYLVMGFEMIVLVLAVFGARTKAK